MRICFGTCECECEHLQNQLARQETVKDQLANEIKQLQDRLRQSKSEAKKRTQELQNEHDHSIQHLKKKNDETTTELEGRNEKLSTELMQCKHQLEKCERKCVEVEHKYAQLERELKKTKQQSNELANYLTSHVQVTSTGPFRKLIDFGLQTFFGNRTKRATNVKLIPTLTVPNPFVIEVTCDKGNKTSQRNSKIFLQYLEDCHRRNGKVLFALKNGQGNEEISVKHRKTIVLASIVQRLEPSDKQLYESIEGQKILIGCKVVGKSSTYNSKPPLGKPKIDALFLITPENSVHDGNKNDEIGKAISELL
jgi:hypothetical protein